MQMVLLRVGIDAGCGGMQGPLFRDGTFEFIPIPDEGETDGRTYGNTQGRFGRALIEYFPEHRRAGMAEAPMHVDPELGTFTYGDPPSTKRGLRRLKNGDILVLYSRLDGR